jgi:hypothetical protein
MRRFAVWVALLAASSCSAPASPARFDTALDLRSLMSWVLDPAADVVWGASGWVVTEEGERSLAPTTDEGWAEVRNAAALVVESGNLLMLPGRARDDGPWAQHAAQMIAVGKRVLAAAEAKDAQAVFDTGGELYVVCTACHGRYIASGPGTAESAD